MAETRAEEIRHEYRCRDCGWNYIGLLAWDYCPECRNRALQHSLPAEGEEPRAEEGEPWMCRSCGRVGGSPRNLLTQGCVGTPERFLPAAERDAALSALRELVAAVGLMLTNEGPLAEGVDHVELAMKPARALLKEAGE